jgi:hypothetical protein
MWVERGHAPDSLEASGWTRDGLPVEQVLYPYLPDTDVDTSKGKKALLPYRTVPRFR